MGLFKPAWMGDNEEKAIKFVTKETNQTALLEIIRYCKHLKAQEAALSKLNDQTIETNQAALLEIIQHCKHLKAQEAALSKLSDQTLLFELVRTNTHNGIQRRATEKITDQAMLLAILKGVGDSLVSGAAINALNNQDILTDIAKNGAYLETKPSGTARNLRIAAADKLSNRFLAHEIYAEIAVDQESIFKKTNDMGKLYAIIEKLHDQALLFSVASRLVDYIAKAKAARQLTDQAYIVRVAQDATYDTETRFIMAGKLSDITQSIYACIVKDCLYDMGGGLGSDKTAAEKALEKVNDQSIIKDIANNAKSTLVRMWAMDKLHDKSAIVFPIKGNDCVNHSKISFFYLHFLPIITVEGKRRPLCPYCGKVLTECNAGGPVPVGIKNEYLLR